MMQLRDRLTNALKAAAARRGVLLARYVDLHRRERLAMVRQVAEERPLLLSPGDACTLLACLGASNRAARDVAELGVAHGASAKLLSMRLPAGKHLHLFDTFKGLPRGTAADGVRFPAVLLGAPRPTARACPGPPRGRRALRPPLRGAPAADGVRFDAGEFESNLDRGTCAGTSERSGC